MPSIKDLKKRITTVRNTQQTTRAMKMVSAAKLRRAQEGIQNHRPYAKRINDLIKLVSGLVEDANSPLLGKPDGTDEPKKLLLMVVTSDRGLCGGFNSYSIKTAQRWLVAHEKEYASVQLGFVGRKGYEFFKNRKANIGPYYAESGGKVSFAKSQAVADDLVKRYLDGEFTEIKFVYNEFINAVTQKPVVEDFLPVKPKASGATEGEVEEASITIVKPGKVEVLQQLLEKNFAVQSFRILLESQAGEHGARMSAMENATKNAGEMIKKLTLQFNKQRQAGITKELLEIISGSESQKG